MDGVNRLGHFEVADADIAAVGAALGVNFGDEARREVLKCIGDLDVQACPGSGKTTLLVAKLAILARTWPWRDRGLCVLSHTNAARCEVEDKLAGYPGAHRVLAYPHFVGTIQTFVDRFLALPYLRECGLDSITVDNDRFASRALRLVRSCRNAYSYLERQHNGTQIVEGLRYVGPDLRVESAHGRLPGENSRTYQELHRLKERLSRDGLFRFDDMFAFAEKSLATQSWVMPALINRFPFVFIDEMQDTDSIQASILGIIQGAGATVQRLGDCNQAIFRDSDDQEGTSFPAPDHSSLTDSRRFCQQIADLAALTHEGLWRG